MSLPFARSCLRCEYETHDGDAAAALVRRFTRRRSYVVLQLLLSLLTVANVVAAGGMNQ